MDRAGAIVKHMDVAKLIEKARPKQKSLTPLQKRLLAPMPGGEDIKDILYQHSVLCQTSMPYRDPGDTMRLWQRKNGIVRLELHAGRVLDPHKELSLMSACRSVLSPALSFTT